MRVVHARTYPIYVGCTLSRLGLRLSCGNLDGARLCGLGSLGLDLEHLLRR